MKTQLIYPLIWLSAILLAIGCEDLEDTYDEFNPDGKIRYVGKCFNLEVTPGWERLKVKWKGSLDATIDKVKITWQSVDEAQPNVRYVEPQKITENESLIDSTILENLSNSVYTITVSNVNIDSTESLVETAYARPYTEDHEDLRTFTRGIINFYKVKDRLALVLDEDNENLIKLILKYTGTDGEEHEWDIKEHMNNWLTVSDPDPTNICRDNFILLPDTQSEVTGIDFSQPISIEREGLLEGCMDTITFAPLTLDLTEKIWSSDFMRLMIKNYGTSWESQIENIETIELDYDVASFQDLLYFPNLKKVILGKNRYMVKGQSTVNVSTTDFYKSLTTLQFLHEINNVDVERYNAHYFFNQEISEGQGEEAGKMYYINLLANSGKIKPDLIKEMNDANKLPDITALDASNWQVTCSDTNYNNLKANGAGYLLIDEVDKISSCFEPGLTTAITVFEVNIDMQEYQQLKGFKVVQPGVETQTELKYLISSLKIEVSEDGYNWEFATYEDGGITIGASLGETTIINIPQEYWLRNVRYIRLAMANKPITETSEGQSLHSLRLGAFIPF